MGYWSDVALGFAEMFRHLNSSALEESESSVVRAQMLQYIVTIITICNNICKSISRSQGVCCSFETETDPS